ncbi:hypothetical protein N8148_03015 [Gammaproteobacteria bacterium]|nr:hypothetical protein [Gammaproteobacteria bacterium]
MLITLVALLAIWSGLFGWWFHLSESYYLDQINNYPEDVEVAIVEFEGEAIFYVNDNCELRDESDQEVTIICNLFGVTYE